MSSYVISKKNYIRAAGYVSGIAKELQVWIYNYKDCRNFTKEDYLVLFKWIYSANARSVQKQYHNDTCENDTNDYPDDFEKYFKKGRSDCIHHYYTKMLNAIHTFFSSCNYQIEDDILGNQVKTYLDKIFFAVYDKTMGDPDISCWGDFDLDNDNDKDYGLTFN